MKVEELLTYIKIAKENQLYHLKVGDIEFSTHILQDSSEDVEKEAEAPPALKEIKRGADGLTAEEQIALYGAVIDAGE